MNMSIQYHVVFTFMENLWMSMVPDLTRDGDVEWCLSTLFGSRIGTLVNDFGSSCNKCSSSAGFLYLVFGPLKWHLL